MLPDATLPVPASFMALLSWFGPLFTAPSFRTFCGLACGFPAQTGKRTVCEMLTGAGLSRLWSRPGAPVLLPRRLGPARGGPGAGPHGGGALVPDGAGAGRGGRHPAPEAGRKGLAASWTHDGSAQGADKTGYGNNWVVAVIVAAGRVPAGGGPGDGEAGHRAGPRQPVAGPPMVQALEGACPAGPSASWRTPPTPEEREGPAGGGHLDHPPAQGRGPLRPAPGPQRQAGPAPEERRPARAAGRSPPRRRRQVTVTRYGAGHVLAAAAGSGTPSRLPARLVLVRDKPPSTTTSRSSPPT